MKKLGLILVLTCVLFAFKNVEYVSFTYPESWPNPSYDFSKNLLTKEKILLGRILFYDPILSSNNEISCASCHSPYNAFTHADHALSHGVFDSIGTRNSPALMNLAWQSSFMWDGAINHLDMQALAPLSHPDEMASSLAEVVQKLQHSNLYPAYYYAAFQDSIVTGQNTLLALSQFMLTLVSANSRYDQVKRSEIQFTEQEEKGYELFLSHCNACHTEPLFSTFTFANNGLSIDSSLMDFGRMKITNKSEDSLMFKIPSLRNIEYSYPYMHGGRFKTLNEVLKHYENGIVENPNLSPLLKNGLSLNSNQRVDLIAFLLSLSDPSFVFNPAYAYPREILLPATKD